MFTIRLSTITFMTSAVITILDTKRILHYYFEWYVLRNLLSYQREGFLINNNDEDMSS